MCSIDILMATYNGEKFVDKQILSIIAQTFTNWRLIVHDDGSTDKTCQIIKDFARKDVRIVFVDDDYVLKKAGLHFLYMLRFSSAPFICFCDQDDIWLENKLEKMLDCISKTDDSKAQVVFSDAYLYYNNIKNRRIAGKLLFSKPKSLKEILFTNGGIHGSASIFNAKMREVLSVIAGCDVMHDHILTLIGCSFGGISFLEEKLFLYRQHSCNVTGNMEVNFFKRLYYAFARKGKFVLSQDTISAVHKFVRIYEKELSNSDRYLIIRYIELSELDVVNRFLRILLDGYSLNNSRIHLWVKLLTRRFVSK